MKRYELEHVIRAAGAIAGSDIIVVIGSQSILGSHPDAPADLLVSQDADVFPLDAPEKADLIDGSIGEMSFFHEEFGYYAHGVGPETATLPSEWYSRAIPVINDNTRGVTGLCLHPVDLAVSKLTAGRPKDISFVQTMIVNGLVGIQQIAQVLSEVEPDTSALIRERLDRMVISRCA